MDTKCMKPFNGKHPKVMSDIIKGYNIDFDPSSIRYKPNMKDLRRRVLNKLGKITGWYPGEYKNYKKLKLKQSDSVQIMKSD